MRSTRPVTTATALAAARGSCAPADAAVSRTVDRTVRARSGVRTMRAPPKPAVYARPSAEGNAIRGVELAYPPGGEEGREGAGGLLREAAPAGHHPSALAGYVQYKSESTCPVACRYFSCFSRVNARN